MSLTDADPERSDGSEASNANMPDGSTIQAQVYRLLDPQIGRTARTIYLKSTGLTQIQVHHALARLRVQRFATAQRRGHGLPLLWTRYPAD